MARTLATVARETHGRLIGADGGFGAVTTDSRALTAGSLFVAIAGDKFDGNDFVRDAHEKGAAGALVSRVADLPLPQVEVRDTRRAFGALARAWRASFAIPVVAVTGSSGKTTVKELVASILGVSRSVCVTQGNLNNDIGVPLTLMRLGEEQRCAGRRARREPRRRDRLPREPRAADRRHHHERGCRAPRGLRLARGCRGREGRVARPPAEGGHRGAERGRPFPRRMDRAQPMRAHGDVRLLASAPTAPLSASPTSIRLVRTFECACRTARSSTCACRCSAGRTSRTRSPRPRPRKPSA